jgi:hypothetical protein
MNGKTYRLDAKYRTVTRSETDNTPILLVLLLASRIPKASDNANAHWVRHFENEPSSLTMCG